MAVNNAVNLVPTISGTTNQIAVTQNPGSSTATIALTSPFFNTAQPMFSARVSADVSNVTGDSTTYTVIFDIADINQSSSYSTGTGIFTAPNTANYLFISKVVLATAGTITSQQSTLAHTTLNRVLQFSPLSVVSNSISIGGSAIIPMTSGQTTRINVVASGAAKTTSISFGSSGQTNCYFCGYLLP